MREILTLSTIIGFVGVVSSFTLLAIAQGPFNLPPLDVIRSLVFLKLAVAGHLTVFVARTRGPFWSVRPAPPVLLGAVIVTQTVATLITVYGFIITPIGWPLAVFIWVYALVWALVITDPIKVYAYRLIDRGSIPFVR